MPRRRRPDGYILILVLVTLALTSTALAAAARAHLRRVVDVERSERELRERWAGLTLRETVLPRAGRILRDAEAREDRPVPVLRANFRLNGEPYQIVLADEQAKLNANAVHARGGPDAVAAAIRRLANDRRGVGPWPRVVVPPAAAPAGGGRTPVFASLGQLFPDAGPAALYPANDGAVTNRLTVWGFGRTNVRRASEAVLREVCRPGLSATQVAELVRLRDAETAPTVEELLTAVGDPNPRFSPVAQQLTETSWCYSLWVAAPAAGGPRYDLSVRDEAPAGGPATYQFSWTP